jgi:hypothetical protein
VTLDPVILHILSLSLGLLMLVAAGHKILDLQAFRMVLADYRLLPEKLVNISAATVPVLELFAGLALVVPIDALRVLGATGAAVLMLLYGLAMALNLARGRRHIDCGCYGPAAKRHEIHWGLVARNAVLVAIALFTARAVADLRDLIWIDGVTIIAAVVALGVIYMAVDQLMILLPLNKEQGA